MIKQCTICKQNLDSSFFYTRGTDKTKLRSECKACTRKQRTCPICNTHHNSFYTKGKSDICPSCYPLYRQAYNLHGAAKHRAKLQNLEFNLEVLEILEELKKPCPLTGFTFILNKTGQNIGNRNPFSPSIDKINPSLGYTKENTRLVCWWYNVTKQRFTDEEVLNLCKAVVTSSKIKLAQNAENMGEIKRETT